MNFFKSSVQLNLKFESRESYLIVDAGLKFERTGFEICAGSRLRNHKVVFKTKL